MQNQFVQIKVLILLYQKNYKHFTKPFTQFMTVILNPPYKWFWNREYLKYVSPPAQGIKLIERTDSRPGSLSAPSYEVS